MMFGGSIKRMDFDVDIDLIAKAMRDVLSNSSTKFDEQKMNEIIQSAVQIAQTELPVKNKKKADAFFAENAKKPGVKTLPDGLQYKVIKEGTGATPATNDIITAHYTGRVFKGPKIET